MKSFRTPAVALALLYLCFLAYLALSFEQLPERVATHFDASGQPDAWMSRSSHLLFILIFGLAFPLGVVAVLYALRFLPLSMVNIPRRDYWMTAERRGGAFAFLFRHSLWFACINVAFVAGIHYLVIQANAQASPQLSTPLLLTLAACFVAAIGGWVIVLFRHFRHAA